MNRTCAMCGRVLTRGQKRFCSHACHGAWRSANSRGENNPNWKGGPAERICKSCGMAFEVLWAVVERGGGNFCSYSCSAQWKSKHLSGENSVLWKGGVAEYTCAECGEVFNRPPAWIKNSKRQFCSTRCMGLWMSKNKQGKDNYNWRGGGVERECRVCQGTFRVGRDVADKGFGLFCLAGCQNQWRSENSRGEKNFNWRGGISFEPYPPTFNNEFKEMIRKRDGHTCAICRLPGHDVHHINYQKSDTVPQNCITLCKPCHGTTGHNRQYWGNALSDIMNKRAAGVQLGMPVTIAGARL